MIALDLVRLTININLTGFCSAILLRRFINSVDGPPPTPNAPREPLALEELLAAQSESVLLNTCTVPVPALPVVGDPRHVEILF